MPKVKDVPMSEVLKQVYDREMFFSFTDLDVKVAIITSPHANRSLISYEGSTHGKFFYSAGIGQIITGPMIRVYQRPVGTDEWREPGSCAARKQLLDRIAPNVFRREDSDDARQYSIRMLAKLMNLNILKADYHGYIHGVVTNYWPQDLGDFALIEKPAYIVLQRDQEREDYTRKLRDVLAGLFLK